MNYADNLWLLLVSLGCLIFYFEPGIVIYYADISIVSNIPIVQHMINYQSNSHTFDKQATNLCNNTNISNIYCDYACEICGLLIPKNIKYALIEHHKSGFSLSNQIHSTILNFCNCHPNSHISKRLFNDETGKSQLNPHYSRSYMLRAFGFNTVTRDPLPQNTKNNNDSNTTNNDDMDINIETYLTHINNTIWFHFTRKPLSTILSAFYYHKQCQASEKWDHTVLRTSVNIGIPRWHGVNVYQAILKQCLININNDNCNWIDTLQNMILSKYTKDDIRLFFRIYIDNKDTQRKLIDNNINNRKLLQYTRVSKEKRLFYFGDFVQASRNITVKPCYVNNWFAEYMYNDDYNMNNMKNVSDDDIDDQESIDINVAYDHNIWQDSSRMSYEQILLSRDLDRHTQNVNGFNFQRMITDKTRPCKLYQVAYDEYIKHKEKKNYKYNYNYGLVYETVRYAACEWLEFFTVHTLIKLLLNDMEYYRKKYYLNMQIFEFEMSQWQNFNTFVKNIQIIIDKLNIIDSIENRKKIEKYFKKKYNTRHLVNKFNLKIFVNLFANEMNKLFIGSKSEAQIQKSHATYNRYDKQKESLQFLNHSTKYCLLMKNLTLSLYFDWEYHEIC